MIKKMIDWINYWFIKPLSPSFFNEVKIMHLRTRNIGTCKWGFWIYGNNFIIPNAFKIAVPGIFSVYIMGFIYMIFVIFHTLEILLGFRSDFVFRIIAKSFLIMPVLFYPVGRRISRRLYRVILKEKGIKDQPEDTKY